MKPDQVLMAWQGRQLRVRHDDPRLKPYTSMATILRAAASIASDVEGLRLVRATTIRDRYLVEVSHDEVRLRRRA